MFLPPWPFGKISFLANFMEVYFVALNAYFWCPKVGRMLQNTSRRILEDSSFLRFLKCFRYRGPLGKSFFWQIFVIYFKYYLSEVYFVGLNAYFWCPKVRQMLKNTSGAFWNIQVFWDFWDVFATAALWENLFLASFCDLFQILFVRSIFCWSKCIFLVS